jgi:hypothetical protein
MSTDTDSEEVSTAECRLSAQKHVRSMKGHSCRGRYPHEDWRRR